MADQDMDTTESHGIHYLGTTATTDTKLLADRAAEELKIKAAMGYDTRLWPYKDYDGTEV